MTNAARGLRSRRFRTGPAAALALTLALTLSPAQSERLGHSQCRWDGSWRGRPGVAADLLQNRYSFYSHETVTLPSNLTWSENPLRDTNWQFQLHSLRFVHDLLATYRQTGERAYLNRAYTLAYDWVRDNARGGPPPSPYSWNPNSAAWRGMVLACATDFFGEREWLTEALDLHGAFLLKHGAWDPIGNHALTQNMGLLVVGCIRNEGEWVSRGHWRIRQLVTEHIDEQGVSNEQSVQYQQYVYERYAEAERRIRACGRTVPQELRDRRRLMPAFLERETLPNREFAIIGDTARRYGRPPLSAQEYAARHGARAAAERPLSTVYDAGYAFVRSGFGADRAYEDETHLALRFGPGRAYHGHSEGTALSMYGWGERILVDSGRYKYVNDKWRDYFLSPDAHNVVTLSRTEFDPAAPAELVASRSTPKLDFFSVRTEAWEGATVLRRVFYSRRLDYVLVQDVVTASAPTQMRQLWHLRDGVRPILGKATVRTREDVGNVVIAWLDRAPALDVVEGSTSPIQGWVSYKWGQRLRAPVVQAAKYGTEDMFLTLIVPSARGGDAVSARNVTYDKDGFTATIQINGRAESVVVSQGGGRTALVEAI